MSYDVTSTLWKIHMLNPKMELWNMMFLFKQVIFRFQALIFPGCVYIYIYVWKKNIYICIYIYVYIYMYIYICIYIYVYLFAGHFLLCPQPLHASSISSAFAWFHAQSPEGCRDWCQGSQSTGDGKNPAITSWYGKFISLFTWFHRSGQTQDFWTFNSPNDHLNTNYLKCRPKTHQAPFTISTEGFNNNCFFFTTFGSDKRKKREAYGTWTFSRKIPLLNMWNFIYVN